MINGVLVEMPKEKISDIKLKDFSQFEEKMTKIKSINIIANDIDKTYIEAAIEELEFKGKKMSPKKVKKVFKRVLSKMIEEIA